MPKKKLTPETKERLIRILQGVMNEGYMHDSTREIYSDLIERVKNS